LGRQIPSRCKPSRSRHPGARRAVARATGQRYDPGVSDLHSPPLFSKRIVGLAFRNKAIKNSFEKRNAPQRTVSPAHAGWTALTPAELSIQSNAVPKIARSGD